MSWQDQLSTLAKLQTDSSSSLLLGEQQLHRFSRPIEVVFKPKLAQHYRSRFRFVVEAGQGFDVVLSGAGTYEEDTRPAPPPHT